MAQRRTLDGGRAVVGMVAMLVVAGCGSGVLPSGSGDVGAGAPSGPGSSPGAGGSLGAGGSTFDTAAADQYCTDQGGLLVPRTATFNTNADQSQWLTLAETWTFCEFESTDDTGNTTRISVDLVTLYSELPTLAALAYLSKVPPATSSEPSGNPASYDCDEGLLGTDAFGNAQAAAGGGWVNTSEPVFVVMSQCMFADGSAIDEWGITYYADGTVRGADLATKFRYQPDGPLPELYTAPSR